MDARLKLHSKESKYLVLIEALKSCNHGGLVQVPFACWPLGNRIEGEA